MEHDKDLSYKIDVRSGKEGSDIENVISAVSFQRDRYFSSNLSRSL